MDSSSSGGSTHHMRTLGSLSCLRDHADTVRQAVTELYKELHGHSHEGPKSEDTDIARNPTGFFEEADNLIGMTNTYLNLVLDMIKALR